MNRLIPFLLTIMVATGVAAAQSAAVDSWYHVPASYIEETCSLQIPADAPCEQGKEKFTSFVKRFGDSAKFRKERSRISDRSEKIVYGRLLDMALEAADECGLMPLRTMAVPDPTYDSTYGPVYKEFGFWYGIERDKVIYNTCYSSVGEPDYNGLILLFERIDGKWYCTDADLWGRAHNTLMNKLEAEQ